MNSISDQQLDAQDVIVAILREADIDAAVVNKMLKDLGFGAAHVARLSEDLKLKLGALARLKRWEMSGVLNQLGDDLPTSDEVLADVVGRPRRRRPRYGGADLMARILHAQLTRMVWGRWSVGGADLALARPARPDEILDAVARFLWQFRNLSSEPSP